jgi:two-component system, NarL family, nitrate/nitrite response regulator NarL
MSLTSSTLIGLPRPLPSTAAVVRTAVTAFPLGIRNTGAKRLLIIDGHAMVRRGISLLLTERCDVQVEEQESVAGLLLQPEVAMGFDLAMLDADAIPGSNGPGSNGFGIIQALVARLAPAPILILGPGDDIGLVHRCLSAGASGYISKTDPSSVLEAVTALFSALNGAQNGVRSDCAVLPRWALKPSEAPVAVCNDAEEKLTPRQRDIFRLLLQGCSNKEIARRLGVLEGTVKVHVRAVMLRLGLHNRTQVAVLAARSTQRSLELAA